MPQSGNFAQKHDVELVKQMVRPDVELRVRDEVNLAIEKELTNLKEAFEKDPSLELLVPPKKVVARELIEAWLSEDDT